MNIVLQGIDLAKNVFQICGLTRPAKRFIRNALPEKNCSRRDKYSCMSDWDRRAFYWQREFEKLSHNVKVISPQYVRPFGRGHKR